MSFLSMCIDGNDHQVWIHLEPGNPTTQGESFIIGCGKSYDEAVKAAVAELESLVEILQGPRGGKMRERDGYGYKIPKAASDSGRTV